MGKKNYIDFFRTENNFSLSYTILNKICTKFCYGTTCLYPHTGSTTKISYVQKMEFYSNFMTLN